VEAIEKLSGVPVAAVFVGPGREQTLLRGRADADESGSG
jgi:hypothetical protein